jgi:APA family basic amino acid/polyamine antiporter
VVATVLLFYILSIGGVFILRNKQAGVSRKYKAFGYPLVPAFYIVCTIFITVILLIYKPNYTWPGIIIILTGVPVYYIWRKVAISKQKQK